MPVLDRKKARSVKQAEGGSKLVDDGEYKLQLKKCVVAPKADKNGNEYWIWTFEITEPDSKWKGSSHRVNTGMAENQEWFLQMFYDAFEVPYTTNTDDLIGKEVLGTMEQQPIGSGPRKGQLRSNIVSVRPLSAAEDEDVDDEFDEEDDEEDSEDEPDF